MSTMKGTKWYNNGIIEVQVKPGQAIPEGYIKGRISRKCNRAYNSFQWYNDGIHNFQVTDNSTVLPDWKKGKCKLSQETKDRMSAAHKGVSKSEEHRLAISKASIGKPGTFNGRHHTEETKLKISVANKGKNLGRVSWCKGLTKFDNEILMDLSIKQSKNRKAFCSSQTTEYWQNWSQSMIEKRKKNCTLNTSIPEEKLYERLCNHYGQIDVVRQYSDPRYPFLCDFYIPSRDMFIELNAHWTHGGMPFDSSKEECVRQLELWEEKAATSQFYRNAIKVWTTRDVMKLHTAQQNMLNYKVLYDFRESFE